MDISAVILSYNTASFTISCIESIIKKTKNSIVYEIIVVDNGSQVDDYKKIFDYITISNYSNITLLREPENLGFGAGNNRGAAIAQGNFIAFINNDTLFENDCFSILLSDYKNLCPACLSPQQLDQNKTLLRTSDHFLSIKREIFGRKLLRFFNPKKYPNPNIHAIQNKKVDMVVGSFMFMETSHFNEVGCFDENLFLYYEETDLCLRLLKHDPPIKSYIIPNARYIHFQKQSTSLNIKTSLQLKKSMLYVLKKHNANLSYRLFYVFFTFKIALKSIFKQKNRAILHLLLFPKKYRKIL